MGRVLAAVVERGRDGVVGEGGARKLEAKLA